MPIIILILATILLTAWLFLLSRANIDDWKMAAYNKFYENCVLMEKIESERKEMLAKLSMYKGVASTGIRLLIKTRLLVSGNSAKKIEKLKKKNLSLQSGNLGKVNFFAIPGYVLQREFEAIGKSQFYGAIVKRSAELFGKKHSVQKAMHLLAKLISYAAIFAALSLAIGAVAMRVGNMVFGVAVMGASIALVLVLTYAMYDDLNDRVKKRQVMIRKELPNVTSKLALLVTSGMIMDKAWKLTAYSRELDLYREMRQTSEEMDNLVSPETALANFINRCNTKETAKLAGAIMQNLSKGNAQIGRLLKEMAYEAWQERRHKAKRDAEKANSKLMIPTMMLFLAILIMLMVPIIMSFSGL
jgi:tight adherence protein C